MTAFKGLGTYGNAAGVVTPLDHKMSHTALVAKTTTANLIRAGLFYNGTSTIVSGHTNMSYNVAAYTCATQRSATAGVVFGGNDATYNVATTAAPGSNSRYDVIYHWHREYSIDGTDSNPVIGVVQGTAAPSPTVPSLAAYPGAIELARVLVPAGVTATNSGTTFTQTAPFTSVDGGTVPFRTTTEMNVWTTALTDQRAVDLATGIIYRWNGTAWKAWESDWISYTPTFVNLTVGSGTLAARYRYRAGLVAVEGTWVYGAGSAVGTAPTMTHPATATATDGTRFFPLGQALYLDTGVAAYPGIIHAGSTTTVEFAVINAAGSYGVIGGVTAAIPFTFASADVIMWNYEYSPA